MEKGLFNKIVKRILLILGFIVIYYIGFMIIILLLTIILTRSQEIIINPLGLIMEILVYIAIIYGAYRANKYLVKKWKDKIKV